MTQELWTLERSMQISPHPGEIAQSLCLQGLPHRLSSKESTCQCRRCEFYPWSRKIPEKEMATYSSTLAREISWTEESGGLQSMGSQKESNTTSQLNHTHIFHIHFDAGSSLESSV